MTNSTTLFVGIDVSKDHLVTAFQLPNATWKVRSFANNDKGILAFINSLKEPQNTFVTLEATGTYSMKVVFELCQRNIPTAVLNPKQSKGFIQGVLLSTTKTDQKDACALALYGQVNQPKPFVFPEDKRLQISQLRTFLKQLIKTETSTKNQLHALEYHSHPSEFVLKNLRQNLETCQKQIQQTQQQICRVAEQTFKHALKLATSVVGIGNTIAHAILVATNALEDFENSKQLAKFIGVCPTQFESGSSVKGRGSIAKTGDPHIRAVLYMGARSAKRYNLPCKALYERLRSKGKCHKVAMIAVCNKMLRQLFAVVKSGVPFDREYHLQIAKS